MLTDNAGSIAVEVPRGRNGTFTPVIVAKRPRRLGDVDTIVLSLLAKGLTTDEISAHFTELYGASVSKETVSWITDRVMEEFEVWRAAAAVLRRGLYRDRLEADPSPSGSPAVTPLGET